ncbi:MAG: hypothetical protein WBA13_18160 [Microcoleaceae cyanobacterium]
MEDKSVAVEIAALKKRWTEDGAKANQAPGYVNMPIPVDKDSTMTFRCPGLLIKTLDIKKDEMASFENTLSTGTKVANNDANRRKRHTTGSKALTVIHKPVKVFLPVAIEYPYKGATRTRTSITIRVPSLVSVDCMNYFLWNCCDAAKRPGKFQFTRNQIYRTSDLAQNLLGTITPKVGTDKVKTT